MSGMSEHYKHRTLYINSLHHATTEESLKSHFEKFGEVVQCSVKKDPNTGMSRCFGFVSFKRAQMVDDAQAARPHKIDGRVVKSKRVFPQEHASRPGALGTVNKIYIHDVADDLKQEDLRECFNSYGKIVGVTIIPDKKPGSRRRYAFVEFDDYDPVDKIVLYSHECKGHKLDVNKVISRAEKEYMELKKEMQGMGRGLPGPRLWHEYDGYRLGGYPPGYGRGYVGGYWQNCYGNGFPFGRGCALDVGYGNSYPRGCGPWRGNFRTSYGRPPVRGNIGYTNRMQGRNDGGRGSGQHGPR